MANSTPVKATEAASATYHTRGVFLSTTPQTVSVMNENSL